MSRIGERIKQARMKKDMSAKQLAKLCGVSESYIGDVESGRKVVSDSMIKKLAGVLGVGIDEPLYWDENEEQDEERPVVKETKTIKTVKAEKAPEKKMVAPEWQSAFANIIKDVPVYNIDMTTVLEHRHLPIIDKKVEGYNPEKLVYIVMGDNSLSGFRIKKGDKIMTLLNHEVPPSGICYIEYDGKKAVRMVKRLDGERVLLLSNQGELRTDTRHVKEIKILGHCVRAEIELNNIEKGAF